MVPEITTVFRPAIGPLFATTDVIDGGATGYSVEHAAVDAPLLAVTVDGATAVELHDVELGWNKAKVFAPNE